MSKYIIKNCPCFVEYENKLNLCCNGEGDGECQNCTDCLLKQIVEKCKNAIKTYENEEFYEDDCDRFLGECSMARDVLDILDIREVE